MSPWLVRGFLWGFTWRGAAAWLFDRPHDGLAWVSLVLILVAVLIEAAHAFRRRWRIVPRGSVARG